MYLGRIQHALEQSPPKSIPRCTLPHSPEDHIQHGFGLPSRTPLWGSVGKPQPPKPPQTPRFEIGSGISDALTAIPRLPQRPQRCLHAPGDLENQWVQGFPQGPSWVIRGQLVS